MYANAKINCNDSSCLSPIPIRVNRKFFLENLKKKQNIKNEKAIEKTKEKEKKGSKKDKPEKNIENLEKELETLKLQSIKGFIIADFPNNLNQCHLLENYLTGYVDETHKPKSLKRTRK